MVFKDFTVLEEYLLRFPDVVKEFPFGESPAVYKTQDKMFVLVPPDKTPLRISLKCDPVLAIDLREKFESVMPGYHLNKRHWITIVDTGQLDEQMLTGLIDHSYDLVANK